MITKAYCHLDRDEKIETICEICENAYSEVAVDLGDLTLFMTREQALAFAYKLADEVQNMPRTKEDV